MRVNAQPLQLVSQVVWNRGNVEHELLCRYLQYQRYRHGYWEPDITKYVVKDIRPIKESGIYDEI